MSYSSYVSARINEKKCSDDNKSCPEKVIPKKKSELSETEISLYVNMIRNSRKKSRTITQTLNQYNSAAGSPGGYGSPPRNKF